MREQRQYADPVIVLRGLRNLRDDLQAKIDQFEVEIRAIEKTVAMLDRDERREKRRAARARWGEK